MTTPPPTPWPERLRVQHLTQPADADAATTVRHLLAVQAQDQRAMRLAIRSRTTGLTAADVDQALTHDRSLVVSWLNRGTLHLVAAEDYWWLHQITAPRNTSRNTTRLRQEGVSAPDADRAVELIGEAIAATPHRRVELRDLLDRAGIPTAGQALAHLLAEVCLRGVAVRGPVVEGEVGYVAPSVWLGPAPPPLDPDEALAHLATRYLASHSPATPPDLANWAGITLTDARRAMSLADTAGCDHSLGRAELGLPAPRLLGAFDPILHGWADRAGITGPHRSIVTVNGIFRPIALVGGRAVATWNLAGSKLTLTPLEPIASADLDVLVADSQQVLEFLGRPLTPPTISPPPPGARVGAPPI